MQLYILYMHAMFRASTKNCMARPDAVLAKSTCQAKNLTMWYLQLMSNESWDNSIVLQLSSTLILIECVVHWSLMITNTNRYKFIINQLIGSIQVYDPPYVNGGVYLNCDSNIRPPNIKVIKRILNINSFNHFIQEFCLLSTSVCWLTPNCVAAPTIGVLERP